MRGHKLGVESNGSMDTFDKVVLGDFLDGDEGGGMLHAFCILVGSEDGDGFVGGGAKGFEAFETLLAVVKARVHAVQAEKGVDDKGRGGPFASLFAVVGFNMAID